MITEKEPNIINNKIRDYKINARYTNQVINEFSFCVLKVISSFLDIIPLILT